MITHEKERKGSIFIYPKEGRVTWPNENFLAFETVLRETEINSSSSNMVLIAPIPMAEWLS